MNYTATIALKDRFSNIASKIENRFGSLTNKIKKNQAATKSLKTQLGSFNELDKLSQKLTKVSNRYQEQEKRVKLYTARIKKTKKPTAQMTLQLKKAKNRLVELKPALDNARKSVNNYKKSMKMAGIDTGRLADEERRLQRELDKTTKKIDKQSKKLAAKNRLKLIGSRIKERAGSATRTATRVGIGATAITGVALSFNKNQGNQVRELQATAAAFNIATEELQAWRLAAKPVGLEADKMSDLFKDISDKVGDFALTGGGEAKDLFEALNLNAKEFKSLAPDQMLLKVGQALDKSKLEHSEKIFLLESLANDASLLLPLLENNAEAINKAKDNAKDYGIILSQSEKNAFKDSQKGWAEVSNRLEGIKMRAGTAFNGFLLRTGAFDWINDKLEGLLTKIKKMVANGELQAWAERLVEKVKRFGKSAWETGGKLYEMGTKMAAVANKVAQFVGGWDKLIAIVIAFKALGLVSSLGSIGIAMGGLLGPIGLVAIAVAALAAHWANVGANANAAFIAQGGMAGTAKNIAKGVNGLAPVQAAKMAGNIGLASRLKKAKTKQEKIQIIRNEKNKKSAGWAEKYGKISAGLNNIAGGKPVFKPAEKTKAERIKELKSKLHISISAPPGVSAKTKLSGDKNSSLSVGRAMEAM